ncbi:hypothetical protein [Pseudomonas mosselii]|uniref:hypothetical protein n=1 Tax=Pseudomonas mosselii TaxID=78327 RepID=UPI0021DA515C|nr:hypothetical protein [Pseudomonas mosselii]MCU9529359.1 hypothetical protein [Pseudomonas mosselii]MCU9536650.1 hypothetical protein [Pseudomonas mosselii]MCU9542270.1 hypothetical protein [Pseudomonas mosselii]MCU9548375.1 hypothetical protein [Pseudomonas mosselii]
MANVLTITLTEFKTLGSSETHYGYAAMDDHNDTFCRVSTSWDGFKKEFPTLEALLNHVLGEQAFSDLRASYTVNGLSIELDQPEGESAEEHLSLHHIYVEGAEFLYGSQFEAMPASQHNAAAEIEALLRLLKEALNFTVGELDQEDFEDLKRRAALHLGD